MSAAARRAAVKIDQVAEVLKQLKSLTTNEVMIGVPAENALREPAPGEKEPFNNAAIGYINETGSPARNIPARPHLVPGVQDASDRVVPILKKGAAQTLDGKRGAATEALMKAGLIAESSVKAKITSVLAPELAATTIAARKRAGFAGESPLIVTGSYLRSITHVLRPKGTGNAQH